MTRFSLLSLAAAILFTVGCGEIEEGPFIVTEDFDRIDARLSHGDLSLVYTDGDEVVIEANFGGIARPNTVGRYVEDGVLVIDYACAFCGGEIVISVPEGVPVEADVTRGDLTLEGLTGPVRANVGAGAITGIDLACDTQVSTRIGSVELDYSSPPTRVLAETTFGTVGILVPTGAYALEFGGNVGIINLIGIEHDPDAASAIAAYAEAGEITVEGFLPAPD